MPSQMTRVSLLADGLRSSAILGIAGEVRALVKEGQSILDLTVGDFSSKQFRIPRELEDGIVDALRAGEIHLSAADRPRVAADGGRRVLPAPARPRLSTFESVLIASGARPAIYALYRALVDPGDRVVFGVPSWNNDYYCQMLGAQAVMVECDATTGFLADGRGAATARARRAPARAQFAAQSHRHGVRARSSSATICDLVLEENARRGPRRASAVRDVRSGVLDAHRSAARSTSIRSRCGRRSRRMSCSSTRSPRPSPRRDFVWVGRSRRRTSFEPMNDIVGHVGAWAPRPEQVATAKLLGDHAAVDRYIDDMRRRGRRASTRLRRTERNAARRPSRRVRATAGRDLRQRALRAARHAHARRRVLETDEDVRRYLLNAAGLAVGSVQRVRRRRAITVGSALDRRRVGRADRGADAAPPAASVISDRWQAKSARGGGLVDSAVALELEPTSSATCGSVGCRSRVALAEPRKPVDRRRRVRARVVHDAPAVERSERTHRRGCRSPSAGPGTSATAPASARAAYAGTPTSHVAPGSALAAPRPRSPTPRRNPTTNGSTGTRDSESA